MSKQQGKKVTATVYTQVDKSLYLVRFKPPLVLCQINFDD